MTENLLACETALDFARYDVMDLYCRFDLLSRRDITAKLQGEINRGTYSATNVAWAIVTLVRRGELRLIDGDNIFTAMMAVAL